MATIALSAVGMALGGSIGGSVLGLSMATIGRAAGAVIGQRIDQQILGAGSGSVETGRIDRFRVTGAAEGADVQQIYGRMRVAGQVIWASQFQESSSSSGGGKGAPSAPKTTTYSYSVSLAVALCEGQISSLGRIWADGAEISPDTLNMRVYVGTDDQLPDPKISAIEGAQNTPAYRGTAYVVLEDLALGQFGNRIPQLTFEVMRAGQGVRDDALQTAQAVTLMPGAGEYALATTQLTASASYGAQQAVNTNAPMGGSDFTVSMNAMQAALPQCGAVALPVTWFGNDLRCGTCAIQPKTVQGLTDAGAMPWRVSGKTRSAAGTVTVSDGIPVAGGTPADAAVVEAISDLKARGLEVVFSPVVMMDIVAGNGLPDPYGTTEQGALPWVGDMTLTVATGMAGSPDGTAAADAQVAGFMGQAGPSDFNITGTQVTYTGAAENSYRRFVLHYAHLCAAAGGVSAFCIGTELAGLTRVRGASGFPMVAALRALAADVRQILGGACKISYAAGWSEYHGMQPAGTDDKIFHLDPLWADPNIDFIGVSAALPLADWREGSDHRDADVGSIYDLAYLQGNVAGGEHYDWCYPTPEARAAQRRAPIRDVDAEPWVWRAKDFVGWWSHQHHDRIGGIRQSVATDWQPQSKPFWFTAVGCPAIDKGANTPGHFLAQAALPLASNGNRDDLMQMQYLQAVTRHFSDPAKNPLSDIYGGRMVDLAHLHVTGWDPRPYPYWPGNRAVWSDGDRYATGTWLNGRASDRSLASVVAEICARSGVQDYDVRGLFGVVRGYSVSDVGTGRAALQPLMLAYGFDAVERDGVLVFRSRNGQIDHHLTDAHIALDPDSDSGLSHTRTAAADIAGRVQFAHITADGNYEAVAAEVTLPDDDTLTTTRSEAPLVLTRGEGQDIVARWLQEARIGRETARFALPPSQQNVGAGDTIDLRAGGHGGTYRIDRIEEAGARLIEATRIEPSVYARGTRPEDSVQLQPYIGPIPAELLFLDIGMLTGDEIPHAPYVAAAGNPWPGSIALYGAPQDSDYTLQSTLNEAATVGLTQTALRRGPVGIWDRQAGVEVSLVNGTVSSALQEAVLAGANTIAIGDGTKDNWEILQFQEATPISTGVYRLSGLLRGQAGSRGLMPQTWHPGSRVVLMNGVPGQITLPTAARGTARHYRFGPAAQPMSDASYRYETHAFAGNGLRPYPVAHLRAAKNSGDVLISWIRCSRIDGDIWADGDIPLGEERESYRLRIYKSGQLRREQIVTTPQWTYRAADLANEIGGGFYTIEVAQISERFGAGLTTQIERYL
ncbi:host specificity protein [Loktanella sp. 5RATIMAR09]|uniref:baseplate multidomain protein megatron n=1 Tax=Loktanella sp. 5RATIMAR09 TaxID=1225655 RepID=UPI0006EBC21A|nr:glycoside hydrolase/phage tail family protein [Loktanella sp. 5RATIMAR09]KQI72698.1 host specificity protein [Loktanella sp. 5RATIMAR09]